MTWASDNCRPDYSEALRTARELESHTLRARDGDIGRIRDCYFDAQTWEIRYLVVETDKWLSHQSIFISPEALAAPVSTDRVIPVRLTLDELMESPPWDAAAPLSPEYETQLREYYGWPEYRSGAGATAAGVPPGTQLRRMNSVIGSRLRATDGYIGHVSGLLIDEVRWEIRLLVADVGDSPAGHQVVLTPAQVVAMDPDARIVSLGVNRQAVRESPRYGTADAPSPDKGVDLRIPSPGRELGFPLPQAAS
jgi:hypothetical protein